jgi:hypothetical protein
MVQQLQIAIVAEQNPLRAKAVVPHYVEQLAILQVKAVILNHVDE